MLLAWLLKIVVLYLAMQTEFHCSDHRFHDFATRLLCILDDNCSSPMFCPDIIDTIITLIPRLALYSKHTCKVSLNASMYVHRVQRFRFENVVTVY